jgi:PAS domain S-box-containing protein
MDDLSASHISKDALLIKSDIEPDIGRTLDAILSVSDDCIKVLDLSGRLLQMSEGGLRAMGIDDFEFIRHGAWPDFWEVGDRQSAVEALYKVQKGETAHFLGYARTMRGVLRFWHVKAAPILDKSGKPAFILVISRDISDSKRANIEISELLSQIEQRTLLESEKLRQLFENAPSFMCVTQGKNHVIEMANDAFHHLAGRRTLNARPMRDAFPELIKQDLIRLMDQVYITGQPYLGKSEKLDLYINQNASAETVFLNFVLQPVRDPSGKTTGIFFEGNDITELKNAEIDLRVRERLLAESEAKFRTLADAMPQMVWSTLPDGYHDYYNMRWYEFTGLPLGSTDGDGWNRVFHPDDQKMAWAKWQNSLTTGEPYEIEYRLRHYSGVYRWTLGLALPIHDANGQIIRWFGTCTDIHKAKDEADRTALLSHELNHRIKNIFAIISGLIGFSRRRFPEAQGFAQDLQGRIAALGRAHEFVRPQTHNMAAQISETTLNALILDILKPYPALSEGRVEIHGNEINIDDRAATPMALIFHELATNAAKYGSLSTPEGKVSITINCISDICEVKWRESDGPTIANDPTHSGFGSTLSKVSVESHLGGTLQREWLSTGLVVTISCPLTSLHRVL